MGLYIVCIELVPALFQKFVVQPSELSLETPYLKNYIEFTRKAYKLDAIQETAYPALTDLTPERSARNQGHDPEHSSLGYASTAPNLSADAGHPPLLQVLQRRYGSLPSGGWLSPGDALDPRALAGATAKRKHG